MDGPPLLRRATSKVVTWLAGVKSLTVHGASVAGNRLDNGAGVNGVNAASVNGAGLINGTGLVGLVNGAGVAGNSMVNGAGVNGAPLTLT